MAGLQGLPQRFALGLALAATGLVRRERLFGFVRQDSICYSKAWFLPLSKGDFFQKAIKRECRNESPDPTHATLLGWSVPSIVITGDTAPERLCEAMANGVPLLHKPLSPQRLREALMGAVSVEVSEIDQN